MVSIGSSERTDLGYLLFLALCLLYFGWMLVESLDYRARSRIVPLLVIFAFFTLLSLEVISLFLPERYKPETNPIGTSAIPDEDIVPGEADEGTENDSTLYDRLKIVSWILLFTGLIVVLGFFPAIVIFVFTFQTVYGDVDYKHAILNALIFFAAIYVVFVIFLGTPFYHGILFDRIDQAIPN